MADWEAVRCGWPWAVLGRGALAFCLLACTNEPATCHLAWSLRLCVDRCIPVLVPVPVPVPVPVLQSLWVHASGLKISQGYSPKT